jgi:hypothetical protein
MSSIDLVTLDGAATLEEVARDRVHAPRWKVRAPDQATAERFAEIIAEEPAALPPPDYVIAPDIDPIGAAPAVLIGSGYVRSIANFVILQRPTILARVWRTDGEPAELAFRLGLREDALGPRAMTIAERISNAIHYHEIYPQASNREIGRQVGLSHTTIDELARSDWERMPKPRRTNEFDPERMAVRSVRALLDLQMHLGSDEAGEWLGREIWRSTSEGEELDVVQYLKDSLASASEWVRQEVERDARTNDPRG